MNGNDGFIISEPKYEQLKNYIFGQIQNGNFPINSRLKSEDDFARQFGLSRGTVRQAIQRLEKEGIVEIMHGKGTFVRRKTRFTPSRILSFIFTDTEHNTFTNDFYAPILKALEREARKHHIKVLYSTFSEEEMIEEKSTVMSQIAHGCFIAKKTPTLIENELKKNHIPFVLIGNHPLHGEANAVAANNVKGAVIATEYLINLGHRKIVHVGHDMSTSAGSERLEGYMQALRKRGIPFDKDFIVAADKKDRRKIYRQLEELGPPGEKYTAIFAANDSRAIIVYDYCMEKGIDVPQEVSLIGFDNLSITQYSGYPITTINVDKERMGIKALHLMLAVLGNPSAPPTVEMIDVELVIRKTCAGLK